MKFECKLHYWLSDNNPCPSCQILAKENEDDDILDDALTIAAGIVTAESIFGGNDGCTFDGASIESDSSGSFDSGGGDSGGGGSSGDY